MTVGFRPTIIAPFYEDDCSAYSDNIWIATVAGLETQPIRKLLIECTSDKPLEFGFVSGTGATAAFYFIGVPHTLVLDLDPGFAGDILYVRKLAGGVTPTAGVLAVSALG